MSLAPAAHAPAAHAPASLALAALALAALALAALALAALALPTKAQVPVPGGIKCSAFLHERDGAWRAFQPGVIFGPRGPIPVRVGERFRRGRPSAGDYVARGLDGLCATDDR